MSKLEGRGIAGAGGRRIAAPCGARGCSDVRGAPRLMTLMTGDEKHGPSATSTLDVLWVLYDQVLRVSPDRLDDPGRDRFLLSKGHGPAAYYAVLAAKGFIPESWLPGFGSAGSRLGYHPDRNLVPGVEIASGSLGHGLPLAVGLAHGLIARGLAEPRVFVLVGDAELDEGSNSEAIVYAGRGRAGEPHRGRGRQPVLDVGLGRGRHRGALRGGRLVGDAGGRAGSRGAGRGAWLCWSVFAGSGGAAARGGLGGGEGVCVMSDMRTVFAASGLVDAGGGSAGRGGAGGDLGRPVRQGGGAGTRSGCSTWASGSS